VAFGLAQVGEFSFVLAHEGLRSGALSPDVHALALTVALASIALTPVLQKAVPPLHRLCQRWFPQRDPLRTFDLPQDGLRDHVVVVGYGRTGQAAVDVMRQTGLPFVIIDSDHNRVEHCTGRGGPAIWGDATLEPVIEAAHLARARLLLITIPDAAGIRMIVQQARAIRPDIVIVARAPSREHLEELRSLGVYEIVQPEFEAGLEMVRQVLARYDYSPAEISRFSDEVHRQLYQPFLEQEAPHEGLRALEELRRTARGIEIEWISLQHDSHLVGQSLAAAQFRQRTGASVVAVRHDDRLDPNPNPDYTFLAGDLLGILGTEDQRRAARDLIG